MIIKKPKFWDTRKITLISFLLIPFTIPIRINNFLYNFFSKYKTKKIITICVGNIYLGGTGKTPTTIKLFQIFKKMKIRVATAKKYYSSHKDEITLLQNKTKFLLGKKRIDIVEKAIKNKYKIIIFDDGLQDNKIDYKLKFVCFDSFSWIGNGQLIPSGPLREKLISIKKYDGAFIKNLDKPKFQLVKKLKKVNPKIKIFNSRYIIKNLKKFNLSKKYIIFSGIGNPDNFELLLKKYKFKIIKHIKYPDHYNYTNEDIIKIIKVANKANAKIITTEKDHIKLPKNYQKKINVLNIDLMIDNKKELINFLKIKLYE